jgi:glycine/D-amino acid oxidase-like deaminating enzyme
MTDAIIIGGGLFGQITAAALRAEGQEVRVFDNREPLAGSRPAACLMKPSWFSALGKEVYEPSLALLDRLYGVRDLPFDVAVGKTGKIAQTTVHWCDPAKILAGPTELCHVVHVAPGRVGVSAGGSLVEHHEARNVIVAAGIWTQRLLPQFAQVGQRGMATLWPNSIVARGRIKVWAPYRQLVGFDRGDGMWVGDGTAIRADNWDDERTQQVYERERRFGDSLMGTLGLAPGDEHRLLHGIRPYAKGHKPCLLEQVAPGLWAASGGAKNGTLAAGWAAHTLARSLS